MALEDKSQMRAKFSRERNTNRTGNGNEAYEASQNVTQIHSFLMSLITERKPVKFKMSQ